MRSSLPWLLLASGACTPGSADDPADSAPAGPDRAADTHDTSPPAARTPFAQPAPAVDTDPSTDVLAVTLRAAPATFRVGDREVDGYAYEGQVPGPTLRAAVGTRLEVTLVNDLDVPTTIHWHGAGAPYEMDGVPWQREPTPPGGTFTYAFELERSGTFWYHPHFDTARQVDLGLYGALVVTDPTEPAYDHDLVAIVDSWGEHDDDPHRHVPEGTDLTWTVNGLVDPLLQIGDGETVRLRVLDVSNTGYLALDTRDAVILAGDQGVRTAPHEAEALVLGPGDRAELGLTGTVDLVSGPWTLQGGASWGEPFRLMSLDGGTAGDRPSWDLPTVPPAEDPGRTDVVYTLQGDGRTGQWRIDHEAFPDVTIAEHALGDDVVVEVRNLSPTNHPFHGHGHAFDVLSLDGERPPRRRLEDTVDVPIHGVLRLRYTATRPGDWMQHCHILPHADGGMMTVSRVHQEP